MVALRTTGFNTQQL